MRSKAIRFLMGLLVGCGCRSEVATLSTCEASDGLTPICLFRNPEDLVALPGGAWLVVSEFAQEDERPGALVGYRTTDGRLRTLYPPDGREMGLDTSESRSGWGSADCPGPPGAEQFAPHGIDLRIRDDSTAELAAVNHGGRQSIEFFEVTSLRSEPDLEWRGCAVLPPGLWGNDVAFLPDGGVVVTHMMTRGGAGELWSGIQLILGRDTGSLYRFRQEEGWQELSGSAGSGPNGVAVSADGSEVFFGEWGTKRLVRLRLRGEPRRSSVALSHHPDNMSWARDGRLLITGQEGRIGELLGCGRVRQGTCAIPFSVVAADPLTLETEVLLAHPATAMGAASAALEVGRDLYIGSFASDRLARVRFEP